MTLISLPPVIQEEHAIAIQNKFRHKIANKNATATANFREKNFQIEKAEQESAEAFTALNVHDNLQSMLVAQMLSIHELQQQTMTYANAIDNLELKQYYTNTAIKLSNCFITQASLLAKLQGSNTQKIVVERVDVHEGGQAIVGNIQGNTREEKI